MNETLLNIGVLAFIVYAAFNIVYLLNLRRTNIVAREFIKNELTPAVTDLRTVLLNLRKITEDVGAVTEDARRVVRTVVELEKGMTQLYGYYKDGLVAGVGANVAGLKAGIKTGVVSLVKNLKVKEGKEESP